MGIVREERIGDCRLILGDCRQVSPLVSWDSVLTDPPFGMSFCSNHRIEKHKAIENDTDAELLLWACELPATHSKYIWMRWDNLYDVPKPRSLVTWVKNNHSMGDLEHEHGRKTEVCAFYRGADHFFPGGRPNDVLMGTRTGNEYHPTQKPVDLMRNVIGWTSGTVFDPFMGSGSTIVAAARMGRKGIGVEVDAEYFDIACKRVEDAYRQGDLFIEKDRKQAVQEQMSLLRDDI